jgi:DNA-binding MarR family transcriptional regulator
MEPTTVQQLVRSVFRLAYVQRQITRDTLGEIGAQGFATLGLIRTQGPSRIGAIAHHLGVDLSVASRQLAALEAAGYVQRERDPDDGRAFRVDMTPEGERILVECFHRTVEAFASVLEGWTEDEVKTLAGGLERLRDDFTGTGISQEAA